MAAKREQILWDSVWDLSASLENIYTLRAIASAGVLLMSQLSASDRERAIVAARNYGKVSERVDFHLLSEQESLEMEKLRDLLQVGPSGAKLTATQIKARKDKRDRQSSSTA